MNASEGILSRRFWPDVKDDFELFGVVECITGHLVNRGCEISG